MAAEIRREYGVGVEKIRVIHNFSERQPRCEPRERTFFFAAGRVWDPAKNFALLEQSSAASAMASQTRGQRSAREQRSHYLEKLGQFRLPNCLG